jgi:lipopolysaccharide/colanic/teichoic acid biosynthesis glycosyltransferase
MNTDIRARSSHRIALLELLAAILGFGLAVWLYWGRSEGGYFLPWPGEWFREWGVSAAIAWAAIAFTGDEWSGGVRLWIDRFFTTVGLNLMLQYGLAYVFGIEPAPWPIAVAGSVFALLFADLFQRFLYPVLRCVSPVLLVGYNPMAEALSRRLGRRVVGVLLRDPAQAPRVPPALGDLGRLNQVVASQSVGCVVMTDPDWRNQIPPRRLLALRYAGIAVEDGGMVFEDLLKRVCWERLDPLELLTAGALNANRSAVALQAVYTNVIGLGLLLAAAPLLLLLGIAAMLSTYAPPFEAHTCPGFQRIPFRLYRFRTRRRSGESTLVGKLIEALHLTNLPRLINVVRGEMALFGPPPVRVEFADRLSQLLFAYVHRFAVKPGLLGWSQCNLPDVSPATDEMLRLEYDLYYAREESPSLDLDVLLRTVFRMRLSPAGAAELSRGPASH